MLEEGYIKLHRSITKWEWYQDANTARLFIHLLLTVNHYPQKWQGITIERGQRVASIKALSAELKMSTKSVRTAINHLKTTNEVAIKTTPNYSLITVNNYDMYQDVANTSANEGQTSGKQVANEGQQSKKARKQESKNNNTLRHFESFWSSYPKKVGKQAALKKWNVINPDDELFNKIILAVESQKKSADWQEKNGMYIPHPTTWLNRGDWDNEETKIGCVEDWPL